MPDGGQILVVGVIEGGPAENAGLRIHDMIVSVDGEPTAGEELESVVSRLRGAPGTIVTLEIERSERFHTIKITRDLVRLKDVVTPVEIKVQGDRYWIGENEMSLAEIMLVLHDRASRDPSWPIRITSDSQTTDPALKQLLKQCQAAKLDKVEIGTPVKPANKPIP